MPVLGKNRLWLVSQPARAPPHADAALIELAPGPFLAPREHSNILMPSADKSESRLHCLLVQALAIILEGLHQIGN